MIGTKTSMQSQLIIIMGVSGTGKSILAENVANQICLQQSAQSTCNTVFIDADIFHSTQAKQMMADGIPLTNDIREQWIVRLNEHIGTLLKEGQQCVVAYSGLIASQRKAVAACCDSSLSFVLEVSFEALEKRLVNRINAKQHFFNPVLLQSQFDSFEAIKQDEEVVKLNGELSLDVLATQVINHLSKT